MGLKEKIENNAIFLIATAFAAGVSLGWAVTEKIRVNPVELQKKELIDRIEHIETRDIPNLIAGHLSSIEPRRQCEIVDLYDQLSIAIEKGNLEEISNFYAANYKPTDADNDKVLQSYKHLLGKKVFFYIPLIKYNDDRTVSVIVKAFYQSGNYLDSKDTLTFTTNGWRFTH
jgi:hypothetical protein